MFVAVFSMLRLKRIKILAGRRPSNWNLGLVLAALLIYDDVIVNSFQSIYTSVNSPIIALLNARLKNLSA